MSAEMRSLTPSERGHIRDLIATLAATHGSQRKAAAALGFSGATFASHGSQTGAPWSINEDVLARLASVAGVSVDALLRGKGPHPELERRAAVHTGRRGAARV